MGSTPTSPPGTLRAEHSEGDPFPEGPAGEKRKDMLQGDNDERVIIIAPIGRDASAMAALLHAEDFKTHVCNTMEECCQEIAAGAGVVLLTEEALGLPGIVCLFELVKSQPAWSEVPLIILTSGGESRVTKLLDLAAAAAGTVTLLERPLGARTLVRSVQVALHSRRRQYQVRDLIARQQREQEALARLAAIVASSLDAILSETLEGIITSWNDAAEHMFGYTAREMIGQPILRLIPSDRRGEEDRILARLRLGQPMEHYETVRVTKDGRSLDVSLTISPIRDSSGSIIGASKIIHDVTERKGIERALREAHELLASRAKQLEKLVAERTTKLNETVQDLEAFSYTIAHDMRAPLRSMQAFSSILAEECADQISDQGKDYIRRITTAAERMDTLIQDVLNYSRIARIELPLSRVDVRKLLTGIIESYGNLQWPRAEILLEGDFPLVRANEALLVQCLSNLLGNAVKFVAPGVTPRVRVWAEARGSRVRLFFQDNGIGIEKMHQEKIFEIFQQLSKSYEGTGIGLAIVKKAIERMGGSVGLESEPDNGSTFWLELTPATTESNDKSTDSLR